MRQNQVRWVLCAAVLLGGVALFAGRASSQDGGAKKEPAGGQNPMDEMMKKMAAAAEPGENHRYLKVLEGTWATTTKFVMDPSAPPQESKGTCKRKWILGGRFLTEEFEGEAMGQTFNGYGITGFDAVSKKYSNVWCDTMGTGMMLSSGTCDASGKTFKYIGEYNDPMTGQAKKVHTALRVLSESKHVFEMFDAGPDGKEFKSLEVTYVRK